MERPESIDELVDDLEIFDDWMERYGYIIELGKTLPEMPDELKVRENKVLGCQSQVWLVGGVEGDDDDHLTFLADSDAHIVRGLIAILMIIFDDRKPEEILELDPRPIFARLGLDQHLSQGRSNGLLSMVGRIKEIAALRRPGRPSGTR